MTYSEARARYQSGEALTALACEMQCCPKALRRRLVRDGVEIRAHHVCVATPVADAIRERLRRGESVSTITLALGCSRMVVYRVRKKSKEEESE